MWALISMALDKKKIKIKKGGKGFSLKSDEGYMHIPLSIRNFDTKEDYIEYVRSCASDVWDKAEKNNSKYKSYSTVEDVLDCGHDIYRKAKPIDLNNSAVEDIKKRAEEIEGRDSLYDAWKPYMYMKELMGVDLIDQSNMSDEAKLEALKRVTYLDKVSKNKSVFRRIEEYNDDEGDIY